DTSVNALLEKTSSSFRLASSEGWGDEVSLRDLMSHSGLNLHYVKGFPCDKDMPHCLEIFSHPSKYGYEPVQVVSKPGTAFKYSGAGFMVLEHLIEAMEGQSVQTLTQPFVEKLGLKHFTFQQQTIGGRRYAAGYRDNGEMIASGRLMFPAFAAGAMAN